LSPEQYIFLGRDAVVHRRLHSWIPCGYIFSACPPCCPSGSQCWRAHVCFGRLLAPLLLPSVRIAHTLLDTCVRCWSRSITSQRHTAAEARSERLQVFVLAVCVYHPRHCSRVALVRPTCVVLPPLDPSLQQPVRTINTWRTTSIGPPLCLREENTPASYSYSADSRAQWCSSCPPGAAQAVRWQGRVYRSRHRNS